MSTKWVVTNAAERIALDEQKRGEVTFTVSNTTPRADRAVFEVVPGEGAQGSWFSTADPQRLVPASGSVAYLVRVAVPANVAPGSRSLQARVYSADSAPEESSVLSGRVLLDVVGPAVAAPKRKPWWLVGVAALVLLVIGVVIWVVSASGGTPAAARASAPTRGAAGGRPTAPTLIGLSEQDAVKQLTALGLGEGQVKHQQNAAQAGKVIQQSQNLITVPTGTKIDLVVGVSLAAPSITSPASGAYAGAGYANGQPVPVQVRWSQAEPWVAHWHVSVSKENCTNHLGTLTCSWHSNGADTTVDSGLFGTTVTLTSSGPSDIYGNYSYDSGQVKAAVYAIDDFGNAGPTATVQFRIA